MDLEIFIRLNKKSKTISNIISENKLLDERFWKGISVVLTEICTCFNTTEFSIKYEKFFQQLFKNLAKLKENSTNNLKLINSLQVVVNEIINPKNDYPIWVLKTILNFALSIHNFENLLPNFFLLLNNDRSSARQIALLKIIIKNMNINKVQEYVSENYRDQELVNLLANSKDKKENECRMFLNKFNHYTGNIISFFCDSVKINRYNMMYNEWIDFSRKWNTITFLCPRKCLIVDNNNLLNNKSKYNDSDIITINLSSIDVLKFKRDEKQHIVHLSLQLNESCTGLFKSSSNFLSNCNIITFKISQELENFRSFIMVHFKVKHTSTLQNFEYDLNRCKLLGQNSYSNRNVPDTLNVSKITADTELITFSNGQETQKSNVTTTEDQNMNERVSDYSDFQNQYSGSLLVTPNITHTCVSVPETVKSRNSDSGIREIRSFCSINSENKDQKNVSNDSVLKAKSSTELSSSEQNQRVKKRRKLSTITKSYVVADEKILVEASNIPKSTQTENKDENVGISKSKLQEKSINTDKSFMSSDSSTQSEYTQTITDPHYITRKIMKSLPCSNVSYDQTSDTSSKKSNSKRRKSICLEDDSYEFSETSFFSSSYKSEDFEVRTRTRVIKKPEFYDSENTENESTSKRKRGRKFCTRLNIFDDSEDFAPPIKRLKTLLPVQKLNETLTLSPENYPISVDDDAADKTEHLISQNKQKTVSSPEKKNKISPENKNKGSKKKTGEIKSPKRQYKSKTVKKTEVNGKKRSPKVNETKINSNQINALKNLPPLQMKEIQNCSNSSRHSNDYGVENFIEDEIELALLSINNTVRVVRKNRPKLIDKLVNFTHALKIKYKN